MLTTFYTLYIKSTIILTSLTSAPVHPVITLASNIQAHLITTATSPSFPSGTPAVHLQHRLRYSRSGPEERPQDLLADPAPPMPKGLKLEGHGAVEEFAYVLVDADSVVPCGADYKYTEKMLKEYVPILTAGWKTYAERQYVSELTLRKIITSSCTSSRSF